ncbi:MAG: hypothetical protein WCP60_06235 [bacterium]
MKDISKKRADRLIRIANDVIKSRTPDITFRKILNGLNIPGKDRLILQEAFATNDLLKYIRNLDGDLKKDGKITFSLKGLKTFQMTSQQIAKSIVVSKEKVPDLLRRAKRLGKGNYEAAIGEPSAMVSAVWISPFVRFALLDIDSSVLLPCNDTPSLDLRAAIASLERAPLLEFSTAINEAICSTSPFRCNEERSITSLNRSDLVQFEHFLASIPPKIKMKTRISIIELILPSAFSSPREKELEKRLEKRIQEKAGAHRVVIVPHGFTNYLIAVMSNIDHERCTAGYFSSLRSVVTPSLAKIRTVKYQQVVYYTWKNPDEPHVGHPERDKLRCDTTTLYPGDRTSNEAIPLLPMGTGEKIVFNSSVQKLEVDVSEFMETFFQAIVSPEFVENIELANRVSGLKDAFELEKGLNTILEPWQLNPLDAHTRFIKIHPEQYFQRQLVCCVHLMSFSAEFIYFAGRKIFDGLKNKWQLAICDALRVNGLKSSDYLVTSGRTKQFSEVKARSLIISHLKQIHLSFNEAVMAEIPTLLEMAYGDPINQNINRILKDSKLRKFLPKECFMDVETAYGELVSYCEEEAKLDFPSMKQPLSLDHASALNQGEEEGGAGLSLYEQIPSFTEEMMILRSENFITNVSAGRLPLLNEGTIDAAIDIALELGERGHDRDIFLDQLPRELALIVRSRF